MGSVEGCSSNAAAGARGAYGLNRVANQGTSRALGSLLLLWDRGISCLACAGRPGGDQGCSGSPRRWSSGERTGGRATWHPVLVRVPEDLRQQFISEMAEGYLERHPLEDGLAKLDMMRLEVEAKRPRGQKA
ncbi:MAG: hypothetical protein M0Q47_11685 [Methanothrix sp.]|uniref:hypothetical protein n=1 Tax=Methanothrix sp. TaxID=90426 RepID=UPI0025FB9610|nr:hypothetical protein [Methanothrix sp.]MCK9407055.1 hypothetical protein [Methanothrix sp.]